MIGKLLTLTDSPRFHHNEIVAGLNKQQLIIILVICLSAAILGYAIGYTIQPKVKTEQAGKVETNPLFQIQTAIIPEGKVTNLKDGAITITDDNNQEGEFPLSKNLVIYKPLKPGSPEGTSSPDIKSIELNQKATIVLQSMSNSQFEVTEISYIQQSGQ